MFVSLKIHSTLEGRTFKNNGADQQRLQISELHFDKFPVPQTFSFWKIRFEIDVCICSNFLSEAMLWIKEVEMVNSVDDLKSSCSIQGITPFPDFETTGREDCISTERNYPEFLLQEKGQSGETKSSKRRLIPSRKTDRLPNLWLLPGHWGQRFCRELCKPICRCSSKR